METRLKRITFKKLRLDQARPLPKVVAAQLEEWLRVELTYSSNAIEGNTLTRIETAEIIEKGVAATVERKSLKEQLEARNHANALALVRYLAKNKAHHQGIAEKDLIDIHKIILTGIDDKEAGLYRRSQVFVTGTEFAFPHPTNVPYKMENFIEWLQAHEGRQPVVLDRTHPVRVAADAHFKLVTVHPFVDGNGRTARLLMNLILAINSYPMAIIRNEDRTAYLEAVKRGQMKGDLKPFYALVEEAVERSLDFYLRAAQGKSLTPFVEDTKPSSTKLLKIGGLANETQESIHTIRYWTKLGLLTVTGHSEGGYQLYDSAMVKRAHQIRKLQKMKRLSLAEIKQQL